MALIQSSPKESTFDISPSNETMQSNSDSNPINDMDNIFDDIDDCPTETTEQLLAQLWEITGLSSNFCLSCPCNVSKDDFLSMITYEANAYLHQRFFNRLSNRNYSATLPQDYMLMNRSEQQSKTSTLRHQHSLQEVLNEKDESDTIKHHPHCQYHPSNVGTFPKMSTNLDDWWKSVPPLTYFPDISNNSVSLIRCSFQNELKMLQLIHRIEEAHTRANLVFNDLVTLGAITKSKLSHHSVELNIFLPNGFFVQLQSYNDRTLAEIKDDLWSMLADTRRGKDQGKRRFRFLSLRPKRLRRTFSFRQTFSSSKSQTTELSETEKTDNTDPSVLTTNISQEPIMSPRQFDQSADRESDGQVMKLLSFVDDAKEDYSFRSVVSSEVDEIYDDNCRLFDLNEQVPYYLRLVEFTSDKQEKILNMQIRQIIKRPVNELEMEKYRTDEFLDYRFGLYECMRQTVAKRQHWIKESIDNRLIYEFPPELDEIETLALSVRNLQKFWITDEEEDGDGNTQSGNKTMLMEHLAKAFDKPFVAEINGTIRRNKLQGLYSPKFQLDNKKKSPPRQNVEDQFQCPLYTEVYASINVEKPLQQELNTEEPKPVTEPLTGVATTSDRWYEPDVFLKRYLQRKKSSKKYKLHLRRAKHQPTLQPVIEDEELKTARMTNPVADTNQTGNDPVEEQQKNDPISRYSKTAEFRKPYPKKWPISVWARPEDLIRMESVPIAKKKTVEAAKSETEMNKLSNDFSEFCDIDDSGSLKTNETESIEGSEMKSNKNNRKLFKRLFSTFRSAVNDQQSISKTIESDHLDHSSSSDSEVTGQYKTALNNDTDRCIEFTLTAHSYKSPSALIEKMLKNLINSPMVDSNSQMLAGMKNWLNNKKKLKHFSEHLINSIGLANTSNTAPMANSNRVGHNNANLDPNAYLLKICGMEQYLIQDHSMIRYEFIRSRISKGKRPHLRLVRKDWVMSQLPVAPFIPIQPSFLDRLQHNISYTEKSFSYNLMTGYNSEPGRKLNRNRGGASSGSGTRNTKPPEPPEIVLPDTSSDYCQYSTISHVMTNGGTGNETNPTDIESNDSDFYSIFIKDSKALDNWKYFGIHRVQKLISLWRIGSAFRLRVLLATYVSVKDFENVFVQAAIFQGREQVGQTCRTRDVGKKDLQWNETLVFNDVSIQTLTLSCRLSISLCAINRKQHEEYPIARATLPLFNYRHCLLSGRTTVALCPVPKDAVDWFAEPIGSHTDFQNSPRLELIFDSFNYPTVYPPHADIIECANEINRKEAATRQQLQQLLPQLAEEGFIKLNGTVFDPSTISRMVRTDSNKSMVDQLRKALSKRDPFTEMSEQEKNFFWRERFVIKEVVPDALPKVVDSVRWTNRNEVCQLYALLDIWPVISVDVAIMLLGPRYRDPIVRSYAIRCLDAGLTDGLMVDYLLQLVQLLRWEIYLNNDLVQMLLRRSLMNKRLGNRLFWHIRSQLDDPNFGPRWCVLLEMYSRGLTTCDIHTTHRQVLALEEIERISLATIGETDRKQAILKHLRDPKVMNLLDRFNNPLDISLKLAELKIDSLRVMDSAKRPLWLEWFNADAALAEANRLETSAIIFKSGDDLRQDMLTLQVIRIMDQIWRRENLDLRMLPYHCLATGDQVGLIEVVRHAKTVMGIQRVGGRKAALQIDSSKLHKWIRDNNADSYDNAVDNFTRSCAGYCVATFILGIGDRNPDNIMVNEDGQIFHIDFGHFLGHFKKKFGINRERVPFVLTYDFLQVITKGSENPLKSKEFEAFQNLCNDAYLALHDNACLLISLFTMMLGRGIPELQTIDDIQYLRRTLQVDAKSRQEALQYFEQQLDEAHGGAWSTKLDWFFHSVKHA